MKKAPANMTHLQPDHLVYLAINARPDEVEQYAQLEGVEYKPLQVASYIWNELNGPRFAVLDATGTPVAAGGYFPVDTEGTWQSWMLGTSDGWRAHWRSITKATRFLVEGMLNEGFANRLETYVCAKRAGAIEWFERSLGMVHDEGYVDDVARLYVRTV